MSLRDGKANSRSSVGLRPVPRTANQLRAYSGPKAASVSIPAWIGIICAIYAFWLLPRAEAVLRNTIMRDDLVHVPYGHLTSYRPIFFLDLLVWNAVFGPEYIRSTYPKLLAGIWMSLVAAITLSIVLRRTRSWPIAIGTALLFVSHPIVDELTLFNASAPVGLSMLLATLAYCVSASSRSLSTFAFATLLLALAVAGYQINMAVFLVLAAWAVASSPGEPGQTPLRDLVWHGGVAIVAVFGFAVYVLFSKHVLEIVSWGGRGFASVAMLLSRDFAIAKWHGMTNMLGDVTQPYLSYYFSIGSAWRYWWLPFLVIPACAAVACMHARRTLAQSVLCVAATFALPIIPTLFLVGANVTPEGWRVCGPVLYATCLSISIPLSIWSRHATNRGDARAWWPSATTCAIYTVLICASLPLVRKDVGIRVEAQERDNAVIARVAAHWEQSGVRRGDVRVLVLPVERPSGRFAPVRSGQERGELMSDFQILTWRNYSNLSSPWAFSQAFVEHAGFSSEPSGTAVVEPTQALGGPCPVVSPGAVVILNDDARTTSWVCR